MTEYTLNDNITNKDYSNKNSLKQCNLDNDKPTFQHLFKELESPKQTT